MASVGKLELLDGSNLSSSAAGEKKSLDNGFVDLVGWLKAENAAGLTLDVVIQHSADGENWSTLGTLPQLTANGVSEVQITNSAFPNVRANVTITGSADVTCAIYYRNARS